MLDPLLSVKAILLIVSSLVWARCTRNPNKISAEDKAIREDYYVPFLGDNTRIGRNMFPIAAVIEFTTCFLRHLYPTITDQIQMFSPLELAGYALLFSGGFLRLYSIHYLGRFFTYQLSIRSDHKLITTGPYSIVRHPSYTGFTYLALGVGCVVFGSGFLEWLGWAKFVCAPIPLFLSMERFLRHRIKTEDAMLHEAFGKEWEEWVRNTPWRIIPFVW